MICDNLIDKLQILRKQSSFVVLVLFAQSITVMVSYTDNTADYGEKIHAGIEMRAKQTPKNMFSDIPTNLNIMHPSLMCVKKCLCMLIMDNQN